MSLFDKLNNKRYDLQEIKKKTSSSASGGNNKSNENISTGRRRIRKAISDLEATQPGGETPIETGRTTYNQNKKIDDNISQKRTRETLRRDQINRQYDIDGGVGDSNVGDMTQNKSSQRKTKAIIDRSKFFEAPGIPKKETKQLNQFDKFNKFSNRILNSPAAKFTTFLGGMLNSPKLMIIKTLLEPTPLADGTMKGRPGVYNSENFMLDEETSVNIFNFSEERESMIPFDTAVNASIPSVTTPSDLQSSKKSIFIDYEFNSTEDMFFIKMAGS